MNSAKTSIAHHQHMISGAGGSSHGGDQVTQVIENLRPCAQRRQDLRSIPTQLPGITEHGVGLDQAAGQLFVHHAEFHGVGTRLQHRQNARGSKLLAQALQRDADRRRVVREIVEDRDPAHGAARLQPALDPAEAFQCLEANSHRDSGMPRGRQRCHGIGAVVGTREIEAIHPAQRLAGQTYFKTA